jgi:hypothetical protein
MKYLNIDTYVIDANKLVDPEVKTVNCKLKIENTVNWPRDTPLSTIVGTKFRRKVAVS